MCPSFVGCRMRMKEGVVEWWMDGVVNEEKRVK